MLLFGFQGEAILKQPLVIVMLAVGQGAQSMVSSAIASMGSNLLVILSGASTSGRWQC